MKNDPLSWTLICVLVAATVLIVSPLPSSSVLVVDVTQPPQAAVIKVVDGDTLDLLLDGEEIRVRLLGIDTPERGQPLYSKAKDRLEQLAGEVVYLETDEGASQDRYDRYLFWIWSDDGALINSRLVAEGLADCYYRPSFRGRKYASQLLQNANRACLQKIGIWSDEYNRKLSYLPRHLGSTQLAGFFY